MALALFKIQGIIGDKWEFSAVEIQQQIRDTFEEYDINLEDLIRWLDLIKYY